jgi:hypothetical protein
MATQVGQGDSGAGYKKFRPAPGEDFEGSVSVHEILLIKAKSNQFFSGTRNVIALVAVAIAVVALAIATVLGFKEGSFGKLQTVWSIGSVYLGYVFATYMKGGRRDDPEDDDTT